MRLPSWRVARRTPATTPREAVLRQEGGALAHRLPQGRAGQVAALGLTILVLTLAWRGAVMPAREWYAARQMRLETAHRLLAHERDLVAALPMLKSRLAAGHAGGSRSASDRALLLPGASDAVAAAALQGDLQGLAQQSGISLNSAETLAGQAHGALRRIPLRVRMTTSYRDLVGLLSRIAAARPLMLVDRLEIHATSLPDSGSAETALPLGAEITVAGFRAADTARAQRGR